MYGRWSPTAWQLAQMREVAEGCAAPAGSQLHLPTRVRCTMAAAQLHRSADLRCSAGHQLFLIRRGTGEDDGGAAVEEEKDRSSPAGV